jgi:hypothetical protein
VENQMGVVDEHDRVQQPQHLRDRLRDRVGRLEVAAVELELAGSVTAIRRPERQPAVLHSRSAVEEIGDHSTHSTPQGFVADVDLERDTQPGALR